MKVDESIDKALDVAIQQLTFNLVALGYTDVLTKFLIPKIEAKLEQITGQPVNVEDELKEKILAKLGDE